MQIIDNSRKISNLMGQFVTLLVFVSGIVACFILIFRTNGYDMNSLWDYLSHYCWRLGMIIFSLLAWFKTQSMLEERRNKRDEITDILHQLSDSLNRYFQTNRNSANMLLIISSFFIDVFGVFIVFVSIFGSTIRPFVSLLILFGLRQLFQVICALPKPPGLVWRNPGFPSLLVTYEVENDFYFSGHTSIAMLATIELYMINPWIGVIAGVIALFEIITVIVLRAHYTMDVFTAILAAFCANAVAGIFI